MAVSFEQFTKQLAESGAISDQDLRAFLDQLPASEKPADGEQLAKRLVKDKKISAYQAQVVYAGKGKTLTMGSYFVLDKIGQGGMGMVLKAQHRMMKRLVAIKVLSPAVTKTNELKQRFQREVEAAARLTHPNIVGAFDAGESNGSPFLVMEYVAGDDLSSIVKKNGPLSVDQAIDCISQAARGLEFAHSQGVIHRDIKPANLLMDTRGTVKILDMGLARIDAADVATQANLTGTGAVMGTVDYMAPEQALSTKHADERSDLYSLGISLWYVLVGKSAYEGDSLMARLLAHRERPIPSLRAERDDVPESLDKVFRKLVAKQQSDRYQTATELIFDLEACRTGASVKAVALAESKTGSEELQNLFRSADSSGEELRDRKSNPAMASSRNQARSRPPVTAAAETMFPFDIGDTRQVRRKKAGKNKPRPWFQDPRALIGGGVTTGILILALLLLPKSRGRILTDKANPPTTVTDSISAAEENAVGSVQKIPAPSIAIAPFNAEQAKKYQEDWANFRGVPVEHTNSIGMKFRLIPPGEFTMGSTAEEIEAALKFINQNEKHWEACLKSEAPRHTVILTQPIYLAMNEVTQAQYETVMGTNPSHFSANGKGKDAVAGLKTADHPVETVSWNDAAEFCAKLSEREKLKPFYIRASETIAQLNGNGYRLPTEAEWEFACRAGTTTKFWIGDTENDLLKAGWFTANSAGRTHVTKELKANPFGLYDNHGNVWEWVQDGWDEDYYGRFKEKSAIDPNGPSNSGMKRVTRGGHWYNPASLCRSSLRIAIEPTFRYSDFGFRVMLTVDAVRTARPTSSTSGSTSGAPNASSPAAEPPKALQSAKTVFLNGEDAGPDYDIQGEYLGNLAGQPMGVQVIARGDGRFDAVAFPNGLPGLGWDAVKKVKHGLTGETNNGTTRLKGGEFEAVIVPGMLTLKQGGVSADLKKQFRQSPTIGLRPPKGAIILFDGSNADRWNPGVMAEEKLMGVGSRTKQEFEDYTLHIEFCTPFMPSRSGQQRGNSGLYLGDQYEIQILDSFGLEGTDNECGGIYRNAKPLVNMCLPPLVWQTYDIEFTCAKFDSDGKVTAPARATIKHNGIMIHDNQVLEPTPGGGRTDQRPGAISIQNHNDPVRFQNIWLVPMK